MSRARHLLAVLLAVAVAALVLAAPGRQASAAPLPVAAVVGDSYAAGWTGVTRSQSDAWWNYTLADLGWARGNIVADPGGGFVKPGWFGTLAQALRDHPIPPWTDFVLVQGGLNDFAQDPAAIPAAVADLLAVIHQQAPHAVPVVIGMFLPAPVPPTTNAINVARAMGDYRGIGATRYTIAMMCSFEVGPDGAHPTRLGHRQIGDWVAWHLANGLDNGTPLRGPAPYTT